MRLRSAIVFTLLPFTWVFAGAGCSGSDNAGQNPDAATDPGGGPAQRCVSDKDCHQLGLLCDQARLVCVQCVIASDCGESDAAIYECNAGSCMSYMACANSLMCPSGQVCNKQRARCVDCTQDADCPTMGKCVEDQCRKACTSDKDCRASGLLCDFKNGACVPCLQMAGSVAACSGAEGGVR